MGGNQTGTPPSASLQPPTHTYAIAHLHHISRRRGSRGSRGSLFLFGRRGRERVGAVQRGGGHQGRDEGGGEGVATHVCGGLMRERSGKGGLSVVKKKTLLPSVLFFRSIFLFFLTGKPAHHFFFFYSSEK